LPEVCRPSNRDSSSALVTPEAVLLGAAATFILLVLAAAVAILIRYLESFTSGLLIIAIIILVWYCSSMYPEAARRLGARAWGVLRDAASSLVDRLLRRHHSEVV
jgi:energy-coupling factor transporter transmembrane protein EcfT